MRVQPDGTKRRQEKTHGEADPGIRTASRRILSADAALHSAWLLLPRSRDDFDPRYADEYQLVLNEMAEVRTAMDEVLADEARARRERTQPNVRFWG